MLSQCGGCGGGLTPAVPLPSPARPAPEPAAPTPKFKGCGVVYGGSMCGKSKSGWSCPPDSGCPGGDCTGEWQAFVREHNIYRCMHDSAPVVWSEPVYQDVLRTFKDQEDMSHSDSFSLAAPAGPAGENLYKAVGDTPTTVDAGGAWYAEIE